MRGNLNGLCWRSVIDIHTRYKVTLNGWSCVVVDSGDMVESLGWAMKSFKEKFGLDFKDVQQDSIEVRVCR